MAPARTPLVRSLLTSVATEPSGAIDGTPAADRTGAPGTPSDYDPAWVQRVTLIAIIGFSVVWALVAFLAERGLYGPPSHSLQVDLYRGYAEHVLAGQVPYRDFAFEYPPLALVPMVGPAFLTGRPLTEQGYRQAFELVQAAVGIVTMVFVMRAAAALQLRRRDMLAAAALVAASPLLLGPLMLARYDLWPALFAAASVWLFVIGSTRGSAAVLGLGILAKVYPVVLAPFLLVNLWRRGGPRSAAGFAAIAATVTLAGLAPFLRLATEGVVQSMLRAFQRPLQVESIGATILYAVHAVTGRPRLHLVHSFGSFNLLGAVPAQVATVQTLALAAVLALALWLFARGSQSMDRLVIAVATAVCAYVVLGKVFSPQYLMWLIAPLALVRGRGWSPHLILLVVATVLTGLYYPRFYAEFFKERDAIWIGVVLGRNLILLLLTGYLLVRLRPTGEDAAVP